MKNIKWYVKSKQNAKVIFETAIVMALAEGHINHALAIAERLPIINKKMRYIRGKTCNNIPFGIIE